MGKHIIDTDICLFDLDGTIINTTDAVERIWRELCAEHNVNPETLFEYSHGTRTAEVLARFFPNIDNTDNKYALEFDSTIANKYGDFVKLIPGHSQLLNNLEKGKWCIVTSGNKGLAFKWFGDGNLLSDVKKPEVFITAEAVTKGKPDPQGYLAGAKLLAEKHGFDETTVKKIVFEDAPVGIKAGVNSGARVIGIASSFDAELLYASGATYVVKDLSHVKVIDGSKITLELDTIDKL